MKAIRVLSLCDGISNTMYALKQMGIPVEAYFASEIEKASIQISRYNFPEIIQLGDLTKLGPKELDALGHIDLLVYGSPCQSLSIASAASGKRAECKNGEKISGKSSIFYDCLRIQRYLKPTYWIVENVASMSKEAKAEFEKELGVPAVLLDGKMFSAQRRRRYMFSNIKFEAPKETEWDTSILRDILLPQVDAKYYLSEEQQKKIKWLKRAKTKEEAKTRCGPAPFPTPIDKKIPSILTTQGLCRTTPVVQVAEIGDNPHNSQANRIYDTNGKAVTQGACGGGLGARGGLYCERICSDKHPCVTTALGRQGSSKEFLSSCKAIGGIRRLCPEEVEYLFNLPKDYTRYGIDDSGNLKEMKDCPRYRALGNSFLWKKIAYILNNCEF